MAKPLAEHKGVVKSRKKRDEQTAEAGRKWPFRRGGPNEEAAEEAGFDMEYVPGGSVRRITFEDEPEPEPEPERPKRTWVPRHQTDVREIEAAIDRIAAKASGAAETDSSTPSPGASRATSRASSSRSSSITSTTTRTSSRSRSSTSLRETAPRTRSYEPPRRRTLDETTRVTPSQVDRVLAERYKDDPEFQPVQPRREAAPPATSSEDLEETIGRRVREVRRSRTVTRQVGDEPPEVISSETTVEGWAPSHVRETAPAPTATPEAVEPSLPALRDAEAKTPETAASTTVTKTTRKVTKRTRKAAPVKKEVTSKAEAAPAAKAAAEARPPKPASKPAKTDGDEEAPKEYQPQCGALTQAGSQCRNSARAGSKYCSSHKGYRPPSAAQLKQLDTEPRVKGAADTTPQLQEASSRGGTSQPGDLQDQCAALTVSGVQCRNSSRANSKYCASHKGYRPKAAAALKSLDTAPRHKGAEDTKPALRKTANKTKKDNPG